MLSQGLKLIVSRAYDRGKPYYVRPLPLESSPSESILLSVLYKRGLITFDLDPVLTPAGVEEAKQPDGIQ